MSPVPRINRRDDVEEMKTEMREAGVFEGEGKSDRAADPDAAAEVLLRYLPDDVQNLIEEASKTTAIPVWQLLLGYTMRCSEWGEIFAPHLLPHWSRGGKPNAARACKGCGEMFASTHANAEWCCNACAFDKLAVRGHFENCPTLSHSGR